MEQHCEEQEPQCSSREEVFAITELAEKIFLNLSMQAILCIVVRVCKPWKKIVESSPRLLEVLFMKPISKPVAKCPYGSSRWETTRKPAKEVNIIEHPYISRLSLPYTDSFQYVYASWQKHFLTQPPVKSIFMDNAYGPQTRGQIDGKGIRMRDVGSRRRLYQISGWSSWLPFESSAQLQALKVKVRGLQKKQHEHRPIDELVAVNEALTLFEKN